MTVYFVDFMFAAAASVFVASRIIKLFVDISIFSSQQPCLLAQSFSVFQQFIPPPPLILTYVKQVDFDVTQPFLAILTFAINGQKAKNCIRQNY